MSVKAEAREGFPVEATHKPESSSLLQGLSTAFITVCFLNPVRMGAAAYVHHFSTMTAVSSN